MRTHESAKPAGRTDQIDINQEEQVVEWAAKLGCTPDVLRYVVEQVGPSFSDVEAMVHGRGRRLKPR